MLSDQAVACGHQITKAPLGNSRAVSTAEELLASQPLAGRRVLIIVENLPVPFDRRVWQEARTLRSAGANVSVICPTGKGFTAPYEMIEGIHIYRHTLPIEAHSPVGYLREYAAALWSELRLALKVSREQGIDAIHACNPPDLIFLVALPFRILGKKFIFDHHDINPELYEAKFGRRGFFWKLLCFFERLTFIMANVSIATNQSYYRIAIERGKMPPDRVFVVRSGPDLERFRARAMDDRLRNGRRFLVGYVGVMGPQEGIDLLLASVAELVHARGRRDIQFHLMGAGSSFQELQKQAASLDIIDFVTFAGRVSDEALLSALSTSDVCVNPDRANPMNDKSTMNKIVEYMALGKPIVQFDLAEGRFSAGDASLYANANDPFSFADKIEVLLADPDMRKKMGDFGQKRVSESLAWCHQIPQLVAAYTKAFED